MRMQHLSKIIKTADSEHLSEYQTTNQFGQEYDLELLAAERNRVNSAAYSPKSFDCPICHNKNYIMKFEGGYNIVEACECMNQIMTNTNINRSGLLEVFKKYKFENWKDDKPFRKNMLTIAKKYVNEFDGNSWMFVGGSVGSGKTHINVATLQEIMMHGNQGIYKRWHEIVAELKQDINSNKSNQFIYELATCNLIYIDDFLKNYSKSDLGIAFRIIQGRHDRNLATLISSEFYLSEIDEMDSAIGSRIKEKSKEFTINIVRDEEKNFRLEGL